MRKAVRRVARASAGLAALAFGYGVYLYLTLPDVRSLRATNPSTTAFMELRDREARSRGQQPRRIQLWVRYSRISQHLTNAVLVSEDAKFWQHQGIDFEQIRESMETNLERMEFARGASTITQQLAKNLFLSPSKNPLRKLRELFITRRLEAELEKRRILELYLNVIEWGDGIYGAEAAARAHFGRSAAELDPQEAALMAGALVNPRLLNPSRPTPRLMRRQQMILRRMGSVIPPAVAAESGAPGRTTRATGADVSKSAPGASAVPGAPTSAPSERLPPVPPLPAKPCDVPHCR